MTTSVSQDSQIETAVRPLAGNKFDWLVMIAAIWFVGGLFVDGWAHNNGRVDESFFTVWHALFYSGFLAVALVHLFALVKNHAAGFAWQKALPNGYGISLIGIAVFALGGMGDMVWHETFGIEEDVAALLSPTHLLLALGIAMVATGPLRAAGHRRAEKVATGPVLFSTAVIISVLTFMTQYSYFFSQLWFLAGSRPPLDGFRYYSLQAMGANAALIQTVIILGTLLIVMRRWQLPLGSFTFIFTLNGLLMGIMDMEFLIVAVAFLAGTVTDGLYVWLKPGTQNLGNLRLFAFLVPFLYHMLFIVAVVMSEGSWWEIHFLAGVPVISGVAGLCLSFLTHPPTGLTAVD